MNTFQIAEDLNKINIKILSGAKVFLDDHWKDNSSFTPFSKLYFIKDGNGFVKPENGSSIPLEKGNVYLLPAECAFSYGCTYLEKIYFHISVTDTEKYDLLSNIKTICTLPFSDEEYNELERCMSCKSYEELLCLKSIITKFLARFLNAYPLQKSPPKKYSILVQNIMQHIHQNTRINLSVKEISSAFFISPSTLRNKFLKETGVTLGKYIDDMVFIKAQELLLNNQLSIATISTFLGFCDQFYFSRWFKSMHGETPSHFRKSFL